MRKLGKKLVLAVMVAVMAFCMAGCKSKIDPSKGMSVQFNGANGKGSIELVLEQRDGMYAYESDMIKKGKLNINSFETIYLIGEAFRFDAEPREGLSNGDKVTVTIDANETVLESLGLSGKDKTMTFKVSGLPDPVEVDAFKDFAVDFTGISPKLQVNFTERKELDGVTVRYGFEKKGDSTGSRYVAEGDEIVFTADVIGDNADFYTVKEAEKVIPVTNVDKYLTNGKDLRADLLREMRSATDEAMKNKLSGAQYYFTSCGEPEYAGYEFWSAKDGGQNTVYIMYKIPVEKDGVSHDMYCCYQYGSVIQRADGTQELTSNYYYSGLEGFATMNEYTTWAARTQKNEETHSLEYFTVETFPA